MVYKVAFIIFLFAVSTWILSSLIALGPLGAVAAVVAVISGYIAAIALIVEK